MATGGMPEGPPSRPGELQVSDHRRPAGDCRARAWCNAVFSALLISGLVACGSNTPAPVEDRQARSQGSSNYYLVQRGDTMYSIAFRYGLDYRKVAAANKLAAPYTIYPGEKILLREAALPPPPKPAPASKPVSAAKSPTTANNNGGTGSKSTTVTKSSSNSVTNTQVAQPQRSVAVTGWRWPTSGKVIRGYSSSVHKGIDIDGKRGDGIYAVADGTVVYAGTGIVGLGELLIVKHSEVYLSAYAHNELLLVGEGERVRSGQKIATKGSSGTDTVKLHFEIRREGKPIDPKKLLPARE